MFGGCSVVGSMGMEEGVENLATDSGEWVEIGVWGGVCRGRARLGEW